MRFIQAVNTLHSNYLMLLVLGAGVALTLKGHEAIGSNLIIGSFAILRSSATPPTPNEQPKETKQ
jgi:hypothetical protein